MDLPVSSEYERERFAALRDRLRSPEDYIRYQVVSAAPLLRRIRSYLPGADVRLLEVGCGTGGISLFLASQGFRVVAVDREQYEPEALKAARDFAVRHRIPLQLERADGAALPFRDGAFDGVVCSNVVEHLDDPASTMREMWRVLRPGGFAFVDFPLFRSPYGGHIDDVVKIPWFHLLGRRVVARVLRARGATRELAVFASLNGITNRRFRSLAGGVGFRVAAFGRSYFLTHSGRQLAVALFEAARRGSPSALWRGIAAAASNFSLVEALQLPLLLFAIPMSVVPGVGEYFASGVKYVLHKPATV